MEEVVEVEGSGGVGASNGSFGGAGNGAASGVSGSANPGGFGSLRFNLASLGATKARGAGPLLAPPIPQKATGHSEAVAQLEAMGFARAKVLEALQLSGGDVGVAAQLLPDL
jgi:UBA/TS-N domain